MKPLRALDLLLAFLSALSPCVADTVPWGSRFHAEGVHIVADATGQKVVFRGVNLPGLEYGQHGTYPYPGTLGTDYFQPQLVDMQQVAAWGFNAVRVPFEWARLVPSYQSGAPVVLDDAYLSLLDDVIGAAAQCHLYVILEMHDFLKYWAGKDHIECVSGTQLYEELLAETWRALATHYADSTAILGFEIMNEPVRSETTEPCGDARWHTIAQSVINAIRLVDPQHMILVDGRNYSLPWVWQRDNGTVAFVADQITPPRLAYCPHVYYDGNGDSQYEEGDAPGAWWQAYVRDRLRPVLEWAERNAVPLMITESGVPDTPAWADVLRHAFDVYYGPLRLSHFYWHYEPRYASDPLRLTPSCNQLAVLEDNPGGTYSTRGTIDPPERHSPLFDGQLTHPWHDASWLEATEEIDFTGPIDPSTGKCMLAVDFAGTWSGLKFYHDYLDTRDFVFVEFYVFGEESGGQDFWIFTQDLEDVESSKILLSAYVTPTTTPQRVRIPLEDIVPVDSPIISAVVFQNMGADQPRFFLRDICLLGPRRSAGISVTSVAGGDVSLRLRSLTPRYDFAIQRSLDLKIWTDLVGFVAQDSTFDWGDDVDLAQRRAFYRVENR